MKYDQNLPIIQANLLLITLTTGTHTISRINTHIILSKILPLRSSIGKDDTFDKTTRRTLLIGS